MKSSIGLSAGTVERTRTSEELRALGVDQFALYLQHDANSGRSRLRRNDIPMMNESSTSTS